MKVVLFCGGLGMRLRDYSDSIPKPMVTIGYRPVLWHVMKYYAYYGHTDFILCLGYRGDIIKNYFLNYSETLSNDFTLLDGGKTVQLLNSDIQDWRITFVDTGLNTNVGERLKAVEKHLAGEEMFLANYSDGLTDLPLPQMIDHFTARDKLASFVCVRTNQTFHVVKVNAEGLVCDIQHIANSGVRINGGYFVFRHEIFQHMRDGEELVIEPFQRLIAQQKLIAYNYDGFWACMDTFKDKVVLDEMSERGKAPWELWKTVPQS